MINDYFDKVYLLNLFKRKDRLKKSVEKLKNANISFEIFNGVDGSVMNHIWKKIDNGYFTNPNYVGCCLSHLSIYRDAIENGYKKILIIEDDNLIHKDIQSIISSVIIPEWKDIIYLGYIPLSDDCTMWDYRFGMNNSNFISDKFFNPKNLWGLFSYGISREMMLEMLEVYNDAFPMEIDRYFVDIVQKRDRSIAICPQLFCCDEVYSDNLGYIPQDMIKKSVDSRYASVEDYL